MASFGTVAGFALELQFCVGNIISVATEQTREAKHENCDQILDNSYANDDVSKRCTADLVQCHKYGILCTECNANELSGFARPGFTRAQIEVETHCCQVLTATKMEGISW